MKSIGIKLADGSFYPLLEEGNPEKRTLDLTTVMDNQTKVQVEVYRTESGSLEGAEYIDTLEITNLKPHENGEPTLCLAIDVDENNELSAEIKDPETGKKSEIQVTLQSRTLAGLKDKKAEEDDDVTISDNDLEKAGLDDFVENKDYNSKEIPLPTEDFSFEDVNVPAKGNDEPFEFSEPEKNNAEENSTDETQTPAEDTSAEDIFGEDDIALPDFGTVTEKKDENTLNPEDETEAIGKNPSQTETLAEEQENTDSEDTVTVEEPDVTEAIEEDFEIPEETFATEITPVEEDTSNAEDSATVEEKPAEETFVNELPDFDDEIFDVPVTEETDATDESADDLDLPDFDNLEATSFDSGNSDKKENSNDVNTEDSSIFELPDFDKDETSSSETDNSLDLPDLDDDENLSSENNAFLNLPNFDSNESLTDNNEDFTLPPDFDNIDKGDNNLNSEDQPKNPTFAPSNSMFSNLYDKETLEGTSGAYDYKDEKEKTGNSKVPMIICIICAVICILAALLTLFVIPSKLNIFSKSSKADEVTAEAVEKEPEDIQPAETEEPAEEVAPAKEDAIVIAETPAAVVPAEPEPLPEPILDIRYKIVWGDTLWDISTAYYKTPWKYKKIAKYNKIRNPDHIISGTYILIPAE